MDLPLMTCIQWLFLVRHCGSRPAGELRFFWFYQVPLSAWPTIFKFVSWVSPFTASHFSFSSKRKVTKRMPSRFDCPEKSARGAWMLRCCLRARLDALSVRARLNSPSLAIYSTNTRAFSKRKGNLKDNNQKTNPKAQANDTIEMRILKLTQFYFFDLTSTLSKPLWQCSCHGFSVKTVRATSASFFTAW